MRKSGLFIIMIGLAVSIFAGVNYMSRDNEMATGSMRMMDHSSQTMDWSPYLGVGIVGLGLVLFVIGRPNKIL